MAREIELLTVRKVQQLSQPGRYRDGDGLYLQITRTGVKSWLLRYERAGRERWMGLGPERMVTLEEARGAAREAWKALNGGTDPIDARRAERAEAHAKNAKATTFAECVERYLTSHESKWRNPKHCAQVRSSLARYALPVLGRLEVRSVDTGLVLKVIEPIWKHKTPTASRVRGRIEAVLDWATVRGLRAGDNPARWKGHIEHLLPARGAIARVEHFTALPYSEIAEFTAELRARPGIPARALEFAILTATRSGEVMGARWDEIDLAEAVWTIPAERMKDGKQHRVPLSPRAVELLRELPRESAWVFVGPRKGAGLGKMAMWDVLQRMGRGDITVHGFRSTFRDWAAERTAYPNHVVEQALAHHIGNAVEAAYRRGDLFAKRVRLMADWASYCAQPQRRDPTVTPLRAVGV